MAARWHFFAGKGGVGKTTGAAAAAVAAADGGERVLLLSTDPAHSLGDALDLALSGKPRAVPGTRGRLRAAEIDAEAVLAKWLGVRRATLRLIAERGTYLDREDVDRFLGLAPPGIDELVGLLEIGRLEAAEDASLVVVDTAPTGHALRLLQMPATLRRFAQVLEDMQGKHRFLSASLAGRYREDRADALIAEVEREGERLQARLSDAAASAFTWLLLPEALSLEETRDGVGALQEAGLPVKELLANRVTPPPRGRCATCQARRRAEGAVLAEVAASFPDLPLRLRPAWEAEPRGVVALRRLAKAHVGVPRASRPRPAPAKDTRPRKSPPAAAPALLPEGARLALFGGKGGVGKTTCAAAFAAARAARGHALLVLSTDPAHSLGDAFAVPLGDDERAVPGAPPGLRARELDADRAFAQRRERYRDAVDRLFDAFRGGSALDPAYDRAVVQDLVDLAPTGLDEIFATLAIVEALGERSAYEQVVVDTAPTGHALRLLAMPEVGSGWVKALIATLLKYREVVGLGSVAAELVELSKQLRRLQEIFTEPAVTGFVVVTRAAELPLRETARLLAKLRRAHIPATALVVNALTPPGCPRCTRQSRREQALLRRHLPALRPARHAQAALAVFSAPLLLPPPRGAAALLRWLSTWERIEP